MAEVLVCGYLWRVFFDEDDGGRVRAHCPDLPGTEVTRGTREEALAALRLEVARALGG